MEGCLQQQRWQREGGRARKRLVVQAARGVSVGLTTVALPRGTQRRAGVVAGAGGGRGGRALGEAGWSVLGEAWSGRGVVARCVGGGGGRSRVKGRLHGQLLDECVAKT